MWISPLDSIVSVLMSSRTFICQRGRIFSAAEKLKCFPFLQKCKASLNQATWPSVQPGPEVVPWDSWEQRRKVFPPSCPSWPLDCVSWLPLLPVGQTTCVTRPHSWNKGRFKFLGSKPTTSHFPLGFPAEWHLQEHSDKRQLWSVNTAPVSRPPQALVYCDTSDFYGLKLTPSRVPCINSQTDVRRSLHDRSDFTNNCQSWRHE